MAGRGVEDGVLEGVERGPAGLRQAHTDGVRATVGDDGVVGGQAVEDGGGVLGDFGGGEAEARGECWVDVEVGCRAGDGVVDAILGVDDAFDLPDGGLDARA